MREKQYIQARGPCLAFLLSVAMLFAVPRALEAQCTMACVAQTEVSIGYDGFAVLVPSLLLEPAPNSCIGPWLIEAVDTSGQVFGDSLPAALLGQPVEVTITDLTSGNYCQSIVTPIDTLPPQLNCAERFVYCHFPLEPAQLGYPDVSENATPFDSLQWTWTDVVTDLDCGAEYADTMVTARVDRTWVVTDAAGLSDTCVQTIWLLRTTLDMVVFPPHLDGFVAPPLECGQDDPFDLSVTGAPSILGYPIDNGANCDIVATYVDQINPTCGGASKIVRTWFVFDVCTNEQLTNVQIIKVEDTTPPQIECPPKQVVYTYSTACVGTVELPEATVFDACSEVAVTPFWEMGTGTGTYYNVPAGNYVVTYQAQDACGNEASCEMEVSVIDDDPPVPICDIITAVPLQADGTALAFAETFDNGSWDNCGIDHFEVRRGDQPFDEYVTFDCGDLGQDVQVTLKVVDVHGHQSQCVSNVMVLDQVPPTLVCPPAVTLSCNDDYENTALTGEAFPDDNCDIASLTWSDVADLNPCGLGTVTRTWLTTDGSGNQATCTQLIHIVDDTPITAVFPPDYETYECGAPTGPDVTGYPAISGEDCESLDVTYTDYTFYTAYPSCYKIVRKWAAIDWCTYSPNDPTGEGIWEHTQLIWVFDTVPPVLNCPQQVEVGIDVNDCADYAQLPLVTADDCSQEVVIENDSPWADSDGADASGTYPKGTHTVTFTAWDGCGNSSTCTMTVVVRDALPPSPVCNNGVSVTIQPNGLVTITPDMVEGGSSDNCTPADQLILQVSPNTFTCQDIGTRTVTLSVTDQAGNTAFCQTQVVIQDNLGICPPSSPIASIGGQLATELGDPLPQMIVGLAGGVPIAIHTDLNGNYQFDNLPTGYSYTVVPAWNSDYDNGVTTFDMVLIRRHILGIQLLDSPYKMIAADVNRSNTITTVDMVHIRQLILHMTDKFPDNTSWRFIDADYEFPDPMNPWLEPFPEQITIGNLYENSWGNDFVGVKVGDVNGSALTQPAGGFAGESEDRTDRMLLLDIDDRMLVPGEEVEVTVSLAEALPLLALQGTCTFDAGALEWLGWQAGDMPSLSDDCWNTRHADEGWLALAWINEAEVPVQGPLWTWRFRAKRAVRLSDVLRFDSQQTRAAAWTADAAAYTPAFHFGESRTEEGVTVWPNPFRDGFTLGWHLPKGGKTTLKIFDSTGKLCLEKTMTSPAGAQTWHVDAGELPPGAGVYLYRLQTATHEWSGRLVRLE